MVDMWEAGPEQRLGWWEEGQCPCRQHEEPTGDIGWPLVKGTPDTKIDFLIFRIGRILK